ncbi:uncharacterized protein METZ01_LOCUS281568 [marine metagenome]|uniref:Uncharacterized protein n=1 Tax=marine metagenome TaxID=408172 RepID=A0A382KV96_9ZZZZ
MITSLHSFPPLTVSSIEKFTDWFFTGIGDRW